MNSDCDGTAKILNAESQDQLIKTRDAELIKLMKKRIILKELRRLKLGSEQEQVNRALKILKIGDYVRLNDKDEYLLDLRDVCNVNLSYTERKIVRQELITNLKSHLTPIADFGDKLRTELPELFNVDESCMTDSLMTKSALVPSSFSKQILALETQRRQHFQKLTDLCNRKCVLLKAAAELKMGPYLANELDLMKAQASMNQIKTNLLRGYIINEIISRSDHSLKALKEVEGYIDDALEKKES